MSYITPHHSSNNHSHTQLLRGRVSRFFRNTLFLLLAACLLLPAEFAGAQIPGINVPDIPEAPRVTTPECDYYFYSGNNILFSDPCADDSRFGGACVEGGELSGPAPERLVGNNNPERVWNYFIQRGLSPVAAAGAMGNIEKESNFDPFIVERGNGIGYGIIQWSFGRRATLEAEARRQNVPLSNINSDANDQALLFQLNYLWDGEPSEPRWPEPVNAETTVDGDTSIGLGRERNIGNGTTLLFHALVERSGDKAKGKQSRIDSAQKYLEQFGNGGSGGQNCSISEGGLTEQQAKTLMMNYGENRNNDSIDVTWSGTGNPSKTCNGGPLSNCTSFSAFFLNKFTSTDFKGGNGSKVVDNLAAAGAETGSQPRLYAVFSIAGASEGSPGHTGIILGIHGDQLIVGHASCSSHGTGRGDGTKNGGGAGFVLTGVSGSEAYYMGGTPYFAYPSDVDTQAIQSYINQGML